MQMKARCCCWGWQLLLQRSVEALGHEPTLASDGDEAWDRILTDEEIEAHLDIHSDLSAAALRCAEEARAKLARDVDRSVLGVSSTRSQRITHLDAVIKGLRAEVSGRTRVVPDKNAMHLLQSILTLRSL
jgi:hypothetical protein